MGANQSDLLPVTEDVGHFSITVWDPDKLRVVHGDNEVFSIIRKVIGHSHYLSLQNERPLFGARDLALGGLPLSPMAELNQVIGCREMACHIFNDLSVAGWEMVMSSELSQTTDLSTWFFRRTAPKPSNPFLCVSLSREDTIQLAGIGDALTAGAKHDSIILVIRNIIRHHWSRSLKEEKQVSSPGQKMVYEFRLHGKPWRAEGREFVECRDLLQEIIVELAKHKWRFYVATNMRATSDSLFFQQDPAMSISEQQLETFVLSLKGDDRLQLINAPAEVKSIVQQTIMDFWPKGLQDQMELHGSWEFTLTGTPWWAEGAEGIKSRHLICHLFHQLKCYGWEVHATINICKRKKDKSVFVFTKCMKNDLHCICVSPHDTDKLRVINVCPESVGLVRQVISARWPYGVKKEHQMDGCWEFTLKGHPWSANAGSDAVHARSILCFLLKVMRGHGWDLVTAAEISSKYIHNGTIEYPCDINSWFFSYHYRADSWKRKAPQ